MGLRQMGLNQAASQFEELSWDQIDSLWSKHHPDILRDISNSAAKDTMPLEQPLENNSTSSPLRSSLEAVANENSPRNSPTARKSFKLCENDDQLRDIVVSKNNSPHLSSGLVSLMRDFTDEINPREAPFGRSKFTSSLDYIYPESTSKHRRIKSVSVQ